MTSILVETEAIRVVTLDLEAVTAALEDRRRLEELLGCAVDPEWPLLDMRDLLGFVRSQLGANSDAAHWGGVIVKKNPDIVIGDVGFHSSPVDGQVEIGYSIVPHYRRRGYATQAVEAFLRWGFQHEEVSEVIARVAQDNAASVGVLEQAGFEFLSANDELIRYRISRSLPP
jgi:ribosomal-protein-alanine N-acetyltransferase